MRAISTIRMVCACAFAIAFACLCVLVGASCTSRLGDWFPSGSQEERSPREEPTAREPSISEIEARVHELVNDHRRSVGLPPLAADARLASIARRHSQSMAEGAVPLGHGGFDERASEISAVIDYWSVAENVHANNEPMPLSAGAAVRGWVRSVDHRANLEGSYDLAGAGAAADGDGSLYFTQIYVRRR